MGDALGSRPVGPSGQDPTQMKTLGRPPVGFGPKTPGIGQMNDSNRDAVRIETTAYRFGASMRGYGPP